MSRGMDALVLPSSDAGPRLELAGGRVVMRKGFLEAVPEISRADASRLQFGTLPHDPSLEGMVDRLFPVGSKSARQYFDKKKIVVRELEDGTRLASVTSNIWDKVVDPPVRSSLGFRAPKVGGLGQVRKYELAQVLTDSYLLDKFKFGARHLSTIKTMAVVDAVAAAKYMQTLMREMPGFEKYEVSAGSYSRSKRWARDAIAVAQVDSALVPAHIECAVIKDKLFVYGPGSEETRWCVFGPIWYAPEIKAMYGVVALAGPSQACFAYGIELTLLDIDIMDRGAVLCPSVELHVGPQSALPASSSLDTEQLLSVDGRIRLLAMARSIVPVCVDGDQVACAVRVSPDRVLINSHVLASGDDVAVLSSPVVQQTMVSRDLWIAQVKESSYQMNWTLRAPVVGESVVVCYLRADKLQYTAPMSVRSTDGSVVVTSLVPDLQPGMSGGALVALHDMALLGVYSGVGSQQAIAAAFTQVHYTDMCTSDAASEAGRAAAGEGRDSQYTRMKERGLGKLLDSAVASLTPVYDGSCHVGMAYQVGDAVRTTCDVGAAPLTVGAGRENLVFNREESGAYVATGSGYAGQSGPSVRRVPVFGERVFVIGTDDVGPYISDTVRVRHVGVSAKTFMISQMGTVGHLPLVGGLVLAVSDGAIIGQCQASLAATSMGDVIQCLSVGDVDVTVSEEPPGTEFSRWLAGVFPMLNPSAWPKGIVQEVVAPSTVPFVGGVPGNEPGNCLLAYIGDAAAKFAIGVSMRSNVVPFAKWADYKAALQSDKALAATCDEVGLSEWLRGSKEGFEPTVSDKATLLRALVAVVMMLETGPVFQQFCLKVNVVSAEYVVY